ncbi:MAG: hypothetical protein ACXAC8_13920 [Candidatus Hodarchaeales archaeon]
MNLEAKSQFIEKDNSKESKEEIAEMLSRFGWKWAVMASTVGRMHQQGAYISNGVLNQLRLSRNKIESGCYSICETACALREIETEIFPILTTLGPYETDKFLDLTSKAIGGTLNKEDLDLNGVKPILSDCISLPCVCHE